MSLIAGLTGLTVNTRRHLQVHSGLVVANANLTKLDEEGVAAAISDENPWTDALGRTLTPRPFGATRGDMTIDPATSLESIEVNGTFGPVIGLDIKTSFAPTISFEFLELALAENMNIFLGGADSEDVPSGLTKMRPRGYVEDEDYLGNVAIFCWNAKSRQNDMVYVVEYPINLPAAHTVSMGTANGVPMTLGGRTTVSDPQKVPLLYYVPTDYAGS